jgi:hypothetical protein
MDVAKVDQDVAYIAMVIHLCCKRLSPMFYLFSDICCKCVSSGCCICFTHMLQVFHLDVAYVLQWLHTSFSWCFRRLLQVFQLFRTYVISVSSRCCKSRSSIAHITVGHICSNHLLRPTSMRVGVEGAPRCGRRTRCGASPHVKQAQQAQAFRTIWALDVLIWKSQNVYSLEWMDYNNHTSCCTKTIRTHEPLYSSSIHPSQQDSLLYTQFSRTHPSSISFSIHSIHYGTHLSLYLNISMYDLVLKDLLRRI